MLNLADLNKNFEVQWVDGSIIHINEPKMGALESFMDEFDKNDDIKSIFPMLLVLINNNEEHREFKKKDLEDLTVSQVGAIMNLFVGFVEDVENDPK